MNDAPEGPQHPTQTPGRHPIATPGTHAREQPSEQGKDTDHFAASSRFASESIVQTQWPAARKTSGKHGEPRGTRSVSGQAAKARVGVFGVRNLRLLEIWSVQNMPEELGPDTRQVLDTDGKFKDNAQEDGDRQEQGVKAQNEEEKDRSL